MLTMGTRNREAIITNLRAFDHNLRSAVQDLVDEHRGDVVERVQELVPVDQGFMYNHIRSTITPGGYVFEVGWDEQDFALAGLPFYPVYVEFGTSKMAAQPSLFPAMQEDRPRFDRDLTRLIRRSVARYGGR